MKQLLQNVSTGEITVEEVPPPAARARVPARRHPLLADQRGHGARGARDRARLAGRQGARAAGPRAQGGRVGARRRGRARPTRRCAAGSASPTRSATARPASCSRPATTPRRRPASSSPAPAPGYASHAEVVRGAAQPVRARAGGRAGRGRRVRDGRRRSRCTACGSPSVGLGDVVAVVGLGLVGQLTVELLAAAGCVVARRRSRPGPRRARPRGAAPSPRPTPPSSRPRPRGCTGGPRRRRACSSARPRRPPRRWRPRPPWRASAPTVCVVGDVPIESPRAPLFAKELRLVVSRSYGPGRYDPAYEQGGVDYPAGYVRWTEGRNLEEVLRLMAGGPAAPVAPDDPHLRPRRRRRRLRAARRAPSRRSASCCATRAATTPGPSVVGCRSPGAAGARDGRLRVGVVGAGAFARGVLLPHAAPPRRHRRRGDRHRRLGARASRDALRRRARDHGRGEVLESPDVDAVVIATRHDTHAAYAARGAARRQARVRREAAGARRGGLADVEAAHADGGGVLHGRLQPPLRAAARRAARGARRPRAAGHDATASTPAGCRARTGRTIRRSAAAASSARAATSSTSAPSSPARRPSAAQRWRSAAAPSPARTTSRRSCASPTARSRPIVYSAFGDPSLPKERVEVLGEAGRRRARRLPRA